MSRLRSHSRCRHCQRRFSCKPRGLCSTCFADMSIREQHAPLKERPREPTEAELETMIAEQMACLPAWWDKEARKGPEATGG